MNKNLLLFILGKLLRMTGLLICLSIIIFWLMSKSPIDPIQAYVGADMMLVGPEQRQQIME